MTNFKEVDTMNKQTVSTQNAPAAIGPYSQGIKVGNLIFTSGQLPMNPKSGELAADIEGATKQSLDNVKAILEAANSSMDKVVKTVVFLRDMNDFVAMNAVYATYFPTNPPARSAVQVARLPKDAILEIEAVALAETI
jgi:2-iminobutanoate/2-iminopropanoate deaminase